jgi:hypothetical protein
VHYVREITITVGDELPAGILKLYIAKKIS